MATNEIKLKITIDDKDGNATLSLTKENVKELYNAFKVGKENADELTNSVSKGFTNARDVIQGFKEVYNTIADAFGTHLKAYQEQETALVKLSTALKQNNLYTEENYKSLQE